MNAPATMESWDALMSFVSEQCRSHLNDRKRSYGMELAAEEVLSNMMRHNKGVCQSGQGVCIWLTSRITSLSQLSWLEILLEDDGPLFNPHLDVPRDIHADMAITDRPIGGLGLFLVQHSVDEAFYAAVNNHNRYVLRTRLDGSQQLSQEL
jgi:serine/threonine-protein kinase RsbW